MRYGAFKRSGIRFAACSIGLIVLSLVWGWTAAWALPSGADAGANRLQAISVDDSGGSPVVHIRTEKPVTYHYIVYDSTDPQRVVVDFPGMDVSGVTPPKVATDPIKAIQVTALTPPTGILGRIELILNRAAHYKVSVTGTDVALKFVAKPETAVTPQVAAPQPATVVPTPQASKKPLAVAAIPTAASLVKDVVVSSGRAVLETNGKVAKYRYFSLPNPPRLVVDLYQIQPTFKKRLFDGADGIKRVRVSSSQVKTRFVFDAAGDSLPEYAVNEQPSSLVVTWKQSASPAASPQATAVPPTPKAAVAPAIAVEGVDFNLVGSQSVLTVTLSGPAALIPDTAQGNVVRFGVKNATISRALRRTIDTSAFPSSVRLITPYSVLDGASQDVKFAVQLKDSVPYSLKQDGNRLVFSADNGKFAQQRTPNRVERVEIPSLVSGGATGTQAAAPASSGSPATALAAAPAVAPATVPHQAVTGAVNLAGNAKQKIYTGKKISLVFDDADLRKIFQLIADVSNLNIIVSDDVKGTISLRLIDVPWDQALDLILQTKNLGMLRDGNVVQILPQDKIRAMQEANLTANRTKEKLEDLATEVISVSYTDLKNIIKPAKELLSARGKITPDERNKQIIVSDVPSRIAQVRKLVSILDTPERQVLIEARIVEANSNFSRDLGVQWGVSRTNTDTNSGFWNPASGEISAGGGYTLPTSFNVGDTGSAGLGAGITFGGLKNNGLRLDLALAASEVRGDGKVISKPSVTTLNGEEATISQGTQIPYQTVSQNGTVTQFVTAALQLKVTPVINPDNTIIMKIDASNNSATTVSGASAPGINTKEAKTTVLVKNGQTTVIGGIFVETDDNTETGVPLLGDVPILGHLFKSTKKSKQRSELLIFITPRIVQN